MIVGARHAMYIGWIQSIALEHGVELGRVIDPLGNQIDRVVLCAPTPMPIELVVPPPPDDWVLR